MCIWIYICAAHFIVVSHHSLVADLDFFFAHAFALVKKNRSRVVGLPLSLQRSAFVRPPPLPPKFASAARRYLPPI